jgi:hypothetical protein
MTEIIETTVVDGTTEYKSLVTPNFLELVYDMEKHLQNGWIVSQDNYPVANIMGLYEVNLVKNAKTIALAAERVQSAVDGKGVMTKEKRVEIMNNARKVRMENLEKKKAVEAEA